MTFKPLTPRMRPIPPRRSAVLAVVDVGASKVVCLIAQLTPMQRAATLRGRTHRCKVLGLGHQRSQGVKAGAIVDLDAAETSIRLAIDAAERMAGATVESIIVNVSGGRLASQLLAGKIALRGKPVGEYEVHRVIEAASAASSQPGRAVLHAITAGFRLDAQTGVCDPRGMVGEELGVELAVASCDVAAARNLMLAIERCHLKVEAMVASPYAAGLATLVDDEAELGSALVDFGGGSTSIGVFAADRLIHVDSIAVGGHHVTMDLARGLSVSIADAERLKTLHGACIASPSDERETFAAHRAGDELDQPSYLHKSELVRIVKPRIEEILELVRDRLKKAGHAALVGRRLVLTGGASQLTGLPELARAIVSPQARLGRPLGVEGLPDSAKTPAFSTAVGLMIYPQVAGLEHIEPKRAPSTDAQDPGYVGQVVRWLKQSF